MSKQKVAPASVRLSAVTAAQSFVYHFETFSDEESPRPRKGFETLLPKSRRDFDNCHRCNEPLNGVYHIISEGWVEVPYCNRFCLENAKN